MSPLSRVPPGHDSPPVFQSSRIYPGCLEVAGQARPEPREGGEKKREGARTRTVIRVGGQGEKKEKAYTTLSYSPSSLADPDEAYDTEKRTYLHLPSISAIRHSKQVETRQSRGTPRRSKLGNRANRRRPIVRDGKEMAARTKIPRAAEGADWGPATPPRRLQDGLSADTARPRLDTYQRPPWEASISCSRDDLHHDVPLADDAAT